MATEGPRQRRDQGQEETSTSSVSSSDSVSASGREGPENVPEPDRSNGGFLTLMKIAMCILVVPLAYIIAVDHAYDDHIEPESFSLPFRPKLEGSLTPNDDLSKSIKLFEGELVGPESLVYANGHLYTGTADGLILDIHDNMIKVLTTLGKPPCGGFENEPTCGRPLGMRMDPGGFLIVIDGYLGLFKVDVHSGESTLLMDAKRSIEGHAPKFLNDLDIGPDGMIYFTDSSYKWQRRQWPLLSLEGKRFGRVMQFNPKTGKVHVLMTDLCFANGVQLTHDKSSLLICETGRARVHRYHLAGPKQGQSEIFIDNLPGFPDNIRASSGGGYWLGLASHRSADKFSQVDALSTSPSIRRLIGKILGTDVMLKFLPGYGMIIELDQNGTVLRSLQDPKGSVIPSVSEVEDVNGELYLGSFQAPFIGKLNLKDL